MRRTHYYIYTRVQPKEPKRKLPLPLSRPIRMGVIIPLSASLRKKLRLLEAALRRNVADGVWTGLRSTAVFLMDMMYEQRDMEPNACHGMTASPIAKDGI